LWPTDNAVLFSVSPEAEERRLGGATMNISDRLKSATPGSLGGTHAVRHDLHTLARDA